MFKTPGIWDMTFASPLPRHRRPLSAVADTVPTGIRVASFMGPTSGLNEE